MEFESNIRVLTVRQPWAWLIVNGYKDIENRPYFTKHRGELLILASSRPVVDPRLIEQIRAHNVPLPDDFEYGGIIGITHVVGCTSQSDSRWFEGPVGWQLSESRPLPFVREKGMLALFRPSEELLDKLRTSLRATD